MTYHLSTFHSGFQRMCLSYSHEAPRACIDDQPTREEENEQNEQRSEALTNPERVRTGPSFR